MLGRKQRRFYRAARMGIREGREIIRLHDWKLAYVYLELMKSLHDPTGPYIRALSATMHKEALKVRIKKCR